MQHFVFLHEENVLFLVLNISFKCQSYINKQEKNNLDRKEILNSLQPYLRSLPFESSEACGSHNRGDSHGKRNSYRPPTPTTHTHLTLDKMCGCVCVFEATHVITTHHIFPFCLCLPFALHSTHVPDQSACLQGCPWYLPLEPAAVGRR